MNHAGLASQRAVKKTLAWAFWAVNGLVVIGFWFAGSGAQFFSAPFAEQLLIIGRLCGLLATFGALTQFVLMGRAGWLEPIFGLDRLAIFHRRNGITTLVLLLTHSVLIVTGYSLLSNNDLLTQSVVLITSFPFVWLALVAEMLFVLTVGASIYIVRKHLKFETWYAVHLFNYLAITLVVWHQLANGRDLITIPFFREYWIALYVFAALTILGWRWFLPLVRYATFKFTVEKVVPETSTATSVYITGQQFSNFRAKAGQFVLVRFLTKGLWLQEHPFSLSMLPTSQHLRLTIRQLGDFTNAVPSIKPGTKVMVSGPYGAFTHEQQITRKVLYITGGMGITPIRAMVEERSLWPDTEDAILLYGNRTIADTIFLDELKKLTAKANMPMYNVLSEQKNYKGETGLVDTQKIARLVPDVAKRDVFVCGPPGMLVGMIASLKELGVPEVQIHYERFSLHK